MAAYSDFFTGTGALDAALTVMTGTATRVADQCESGAVEECQIRLTTALASARQWASAAYDFDEVGNPSTFINQDGSGVFYTGYTIRDTDSSGSLHLLRNGVQVAGPIAFSLTGWHVLGIHHDGAGKVTGFLDHRPVLSYTDGSPITALYSGFGHSYNAFVSLHSDDFATSEGDPIWPPLLHRRLRRLDQLLGA